MFIGLSGGMEASAQEIKKLPSLLKSLIPQQAQIQYGGSIGFVSTGIGYSLWQEKGNLSIHAGFVPEKQGGAFSILALKLAYQPFQFNLGKSFEIKPFNPVIFPSYTLGSNFSYRFSTNQYRPNYYFWSTALRLHMGASSEIKFYYKPKSFTQPKPNAISLYAEVNTNDLYAISWFINRKVAPFSQIFRLGFGLKTYF